MKISVVTPSFNAGPFLAQTTASVLSQQGSFELEWIVIDGGSTDGSFEELASATANDSRVQLIREPDRGQTHAINKALARASGDIVGWLNSDDLYADGALAAVADVFGRNPQENWLVGHCEIVDAAGRPMRSAVARYKEFRLHRYRRAKLLRENFIPQPAVFWRREFGERIGTLDESLHYTMDYDLWLRMSAIQPPYVLRRPLAKFRLHAASKSGQFDRRQFDEQYEVACRYANDRWTRFSHRAHVEKIVLAYRAMRWLGL